MMPLIPYIVSASYNLCKKLKLCEQRIERYLCAKFEELNWQKGASKCVNIITKSANRSMDEPQFKEGRAVQDRIDGGKTFS